MVLENVLKLPLETLCELVERFLALKLLYLVAVCAIQSNESRLATGEKRIS